MNKIDKEKKKRLLFVIPSFAIGGITSSLHSLLSALDYSKVEIDIFCRQKTGPLKDAFPKAKILPENIWLSAGIEEGSCMKKICFGFFKGVRILLRYLRIDMNILYGKIGGHQLNTLQYDVVLSFHEGLSPIVCYYPAKKHIAWIHSDYNRHRAMVGKDELKQYQLFNKIVCVSEFARSVFTKIYPSLDNKTIAIHNIIPVKEIRLKAKETASLDERYKTDAFTIVSVGRLDPVKQFDRIPEIAAHIKRLTNVPFRWFIIGGSRGYGEVDSFMANTIENNGVKSEVILLGEKTNVYPYIGCADLYVCTSESESFPLAVNEAKALGVPIVSNAFPSVKESITDGVDGRIVGLDSMASAIAKLMTHKVKLNEGSIDNETPLRHFYELMAIS